MAKAKSKWPVKKAHVVTASISFFVLILFLWLMNNVQPVSDAANKVGIKG